MQFFRVERDVTMKDYDVRCKRQEEYNYCLRKNIENTNISKVHVLYDKDVDRRELMLLNFPMDKIVLYHLGKYLFYSDAFDYCNKYLSGEKCIVLHSDIYFAQGENILTDLTYDNTVYALARTNIDKSGRRTGRGIRTFNINGKTHCASIDGWCFRSPLKQEIIDNSQHQQNVWGSENRLIWLFGYHGYKVYTPNPDKVVMYHWHFTELRNNQNNNWITKDGTLIPATSQFDNYRKKIGGHVGGMIPVAEGCSLIIL